MAHQQFRFGVRKTHLFGTIHHRVHKIPNVGGSTARNGRRGINKGFIFNVDRFTRGVEQVLHHHQFNSGHCIGRSKCGHPPANLGWQVGHSPNHLAHLQRFCNSGYFYPRHNGQKYLLGVYMGAQAIKKDVSILWLHGQDDQICPLETVFRCAVHRANVFLRQNRRPFG